MTFNEVSDNCGHSRVIVWTLNLWWFNHWHWNDFSKTWNSLIEMHANFDRGHENVCWSPLFCYSALVVWVHLLNFIQAVLNRDILRSSSGFLIFASQIPSIIVAWEYITGLKQCENFYPTIWRTVKWNRCFMKPFTGVVAVRAIRTKWSAPVPQPSCGQSSHALLAALREQSKLSSFRADIILTVAVREPVDVVTVVKTWTNTDGRLYDIHILAPNTQIGHFFSFFECG
jgi:hypothetical protein